MQFFQISLLSSQQCESSEGHCDVTEAIEV